MENSELFKYEVILHWSAVFSYIVAAFFFVQGVAFRKEKAFNHGMKLIVAGLCLSRAVPS
jgi:fucose 4-O-acetylase-like acetyltransferase